MKLHQRVTGSEEYLALCDRERERMKQAYMTDMVGLLEDLPDILNVRVSEHSREYMRSYEQIENLLKESGITYYDPILSEANSYANAAERDGFRRGFRMAMQLCMEGMMGGVAV